MQQYAELVSICKLVFYFRLNGESGSEGCTSDQWREMRSLVCVLTWTWLLCVASPRERVVRRECKDRRGPVAPPHSSCSARATPWSGLEYQASATSFVQRQVRQSIFYVSISSRNKSHLNKGTLSYENQSLKISQSDLKFDWFELTRLFYFKDML